MSVLIPAGVRAIFFDAVGTLIHPEPVAPAVYAEVGRRHGSRFDAAAIAARFRSAFQREEETDRAAGWRTSEAREIERWRRIVGDVVCDADDPEACFQTLFAHFSRPRAWRIDPDAALLLPALAARGYTLGVASNYDHRLRGVAAGLPEFTLLTNLAISAEIGWRKPAPEFFTALSERVRLPPEQILLVGDDMLNDFEGARASGLQAVLVDPQSSIASPVCIPRLRELLA